MGRLTADEIVEELVNNCREDRKRLVDQVDVARQLNARTIDDPGTAIALADNLIAVTEVLTKVNAQLGEAAKIQAKRESRSPNSEGLDEDEVEGVFDEIDESN